jgi:hypothetical protein
MIELCFPGADDLRLSKKEAVGGCRVCLRSKFTPTAALSEPPCHEACEPRTCARFGVFIRGGLIAFFGLLNRPCFHYIEIGERSLIQGPVCILIATEFAALSTPPLIHRVMPVVRSRLLHTRSRTPVVAFATPDRRDENRCNGPSFEKWPHRPLETT